ncbi:MAG: sirohydrochlorin chelatase [Rhodobacteraceae bacterium]|nr:sirohydrochlorin chelatase [Paracoccaceae bacterium]
MDSIGVLICGHGSRSESAVAEFAAMVREVPAHLPDWPVAHGYLEFANPVIHKGLEELQARGCNRILAVPGMLFAAMHAKNDIPAVLNTYSAKHRISVAYGRELGLDPKLLEASAHRITAAEEQANHDRGFVPRERTCLVVIGRGASDPDANGNIAKLSRMLWEGMGFGWCELGYSGVTFPLVEPCLQHTAKLGFERILVFPYFLFGGILIDRIYGFTDQVAAEHPDLQMVKAGYLGDHPRVPETFADRAREIIDGDVAMNCMLCKYRSRVLGFGHEVGTPQESHHHHVEGQGASAPGSHVEDCELCGTFCTGACRLDQIHHHHPDHHHDHHHPVYPFSEHPLGPESVRKTLKQPS